MTTDCVFQIPQIEVKKRHKAHIQVINAVIPYSFYNINVTNNILKYVMRLPDTTTTAVQTVIIPFANYNITTLIAKLKQLMDSDFNITYNSSTNKLNITHTINTFWFVDGTNCNEIIGLNEIFPSVETNNWLSDVSINLFTIRNIQVSSSNFIMNNICSTTPNKASIITSIPINVNMGSIINYSNINNISSFIHEITNINNLHIQLLDQDGDLLDLNGLHWSVNLLLIIE
jgi:hypothetical protein